MNLKCIILFALLPILCSGAGLRVGTGQADITPPLGTPLAGYYFERGSEGVRDPLYAKAMVLDSAGTKVALVQLDLISTSRWFVEEARAEIEKRIGLPGSNVLISATHAHTGPILPRTSPRYDAQGGSNPHALEFGRKLPGLIAQAVELAHANLTETSLSIGVGREEGLAFNRRFFMKDGTVGWNPGKLNPQVVRPAGPTDPEVSVIYFQRTNASPLACYVNFAIHLDNVGGRFISADAPATLAKLMTDARGTNFFTMFHNGTCGNINHLNVAITRSQTSPEEAARIGTILAANVLKTMDHGMRSVQAPLQLKVSSELVKLPLASIKPGEEAQAAQVIAQDKGQNSVNRPAFLALVNAFKVKDVAAREGKPLEVEVQVFTLGDEIAWVSLPGEIFVELGLAIKHGSPFKQTMLAELANGSIGYIPNREAYPQGNYEVISARCAEGSGEMLVDSALRQLRTLYSSR